jgi:hypothetical protein
VYRLKPGEAICFNNRRILHGRKGFELNGVRHFQVSLKVNKSYLKKMNVKLIIKRDAT